MYAFSQDETHLLFIDCFGLTRLSAPKKIKTERKIMGSDCAGLATLARDGSMAGSYEDIWDKSVLWNFPELKSAKRFDRFREKGLVVHPDATHYIVVDSGKLRLEPAEANAVLLPFRLDGVVDPKSKGAEAVTLALGGGQQLEPLALGGDQSPTVHVPLRVAHDGTLLYYNGSGELMCAQLSGTTLTPKWRRKLLSAENARVDVCADAERCVLALHRGRVWTIHVRNEADGKQRSFELESLSVPAVAGPYLAWQRDASTVVRRDLRDDSEAEFSVEVYDKKRKIDDKNTGPGVIFAGAKGRLLFLCGHRETLVDLVKGVEISRKLPPKEYFLRHSLLSRAAPYINGARSVGASIELGRVEFQAKHTSVSVTHHISGQPSLLGALLASHSQAVWSDASFPEGWRMGSYGSHGGIRAESTATSAQLVEGYATLAESGVSFASTISYWADAFEERSWGPGAPKDVETLAFLGQALLATAREGAEAKLDFKALAAAGVPSVEALVAGFAAYPTTSKALPYNTTKFVGALYNRLLGAGAAQLWYALLFEIDGFDGGSSYSDLGREAVQPLIEAHPETAGVFREWFANNEISEDDPRRWSLNQLRDSLA